jgi:putative MFS transporter
MKSNESRPAADPRVVTAACGLVWLVASASLIAASGVYPALLAEWRIDPEFVGVWGSATLAGMLAGGILGGLLADRFGRRPVLTGSALLMGLTIPAQVFLTSPWAFAAGRFVAGLVMAGAIPAAAALVSEVAPAELRGRLTWVLEGFWTAGSVVGALLALGLIPAAGWQAVFLAFLPAALYALPLLRIVPESPRFRQLSRADRPSIARLWAGPFRKRTLFLWVLWLVMLSAYYGIYAWLPTLLVGQGLSLESSLTDLVWVSLAQLPGAVAAGWLADTLGRRPTLTLFLLGCAAACVGLAFAPGGAAVVFLAGLLGFTNIGAWVLVYIYTPELYPTALRATGVGTAGTVGRVGAIAAPYLVGLLSRSSGFGAAFLGFGGLLLAGALATAVLAEETRGKTLEQISGG